MIALSSLTIGELAAYIAEQAILIARNRTIDIEEVRRWSVNEGFAEIFEKNVSRLLSEKEE